MESWWWTKKKRKDFSLLSFVDAITKCDLLQTKNKKQHLQLELQLIADKITTVHIGWALVAEVSWNHPWISNITSINCVRDGDLFSIFSIFQFSKTILGFKKVNYSFCGAEDICPFEERHFYSDSILWVTDLDIRPLTILFWSDFAHLISKHRFGQEL